MYQLIYLRVFMLSLKIFILSICIKVLYSPSFFVCGCCNPVSMLHARGYDWEWGHLMVSGD